MLSDEQKAEVLKIEKEIEALVKKFIYLKKLPFPKRINTQISRVDKMLLLSAQARMKEIERQDVILQPPKHKLAGISIINTLIKNSDQRIKGANEIINHYRHAK